MTVPLLRFPLLVLKIIFMQLKLCEILSLATTAITARECLKSCLRHQKFKISYEVNRSVRFYKVIPGELPLLSNGLEIRIVEKAEQNPVYPYQVWKFLGQNSAYVRMVESITNPIVLVYLEDTTDALPRMVQFLVDLFKSPQLSLNFGLGSPDSCRASIRFIKGLEVDVDYVSVFASMRRRRAVHNELMRIAMEECQDLKSVDIECENTELNLEIAQPFNCDYISISSAEWITKEQLVEFFFNCKNVSLRKKNYEDQDLTYIFERWVDQTDSKIECLGITGSNNFYCRKSLTNIVGQLSGATPVQKAIVYYGEISGVVEFAEGKCYFIKQKDGKRDALVFMWCNAINLAEKYEIGEHIDEMEAASSESELEDSDDEDPEVEERDEEDDDSD